MLTSSASVAPAAPPMATPAPPAEPLLGLGPVRHTRLRPVRNAFAYPAFFLLLPMRRLRDQPWPALARNRFAPIAFHDADHGEGGPDSLAWLEALLAREGVNDVDGEIWLQCLPRVWGYAFRPVSFWYAHRADGSLAAIVAEVNNTFGERHCYVLRQGPGGAALAWGQALCADKVFHVSPFCSVQGEYHFRFLRSDLAAAQDGALPPGLARRGRLVARIEHHDAAGPLLLTSQAGELTPLTPAAQRHALWRMPLMTLGVITRIHWQALRLWLARVPVVDHPGRRAARGPSLSSGTPR